MAVTQVGDCQMSRMKPFLSNEDNRQQSQQSTHSCAAATAAAAANTRRRTTQPQRIEVMPRFAENT